MYPCPNCGGQLKFDIAAQKLSCVQCSSQFNPYSVTEQNNAEEDTYMDVTVFRCPQCGGEILSSDNTAANFCSFCGASTVLESNIRKEKRPSYIIPFTKTKDDCKKAYSKYMRHAWFAPKELKDASHIDGFRGIYMPYWAYHITDRGPVAFPGSKSHRRGDYIITDRYSLEGNINSSYKGISYDASSSFDDELSRSIAPFDVRNMNAFTPSYLSGFYADTADVSSDVYVDEAKDVAATQMYNYVKSLPGTKHFSFDELGDYAKSRLNPVCEKADGAMFPVWFLSYRNKDRVAYATVNGQTGKVSADMPVSVPKYLLCSMLLAIPLFILFNAMLTVLPKTILGVSSIVAAVVTFIFAAELKAIAKKDGFVNLNDKKSKMKMSRRGRTATAVALVAGAISILWPLAAVLFVLFSYSSLMVLASLVAGTIGFSMSVKPYKAGNRQGAPATIAILLALILATAVSVINPVSDLYYYGAAIINLLAVLLSLVSIISNYNVLATRKLPQFDMYKGGDDRA